ncbi:hypothetical protein BsWGS_24242 [Bradybaena similaris]
MSSLMPDDCVYFLDTPRHRGHDLAVWFVSHAFMQGDKHCDKLRCLIRDTEEVHPGFMSSPVIGLTLFRCIQTTRQDVILCLLSEGADVNMMFRGRCMLHEAVKTSKEGMLSFLLSLPGVEKDKFDVEMRTPLMDAARGRPKCLKILLEGGCDMKLTDSKGDTAFHHAFQAPRPHRDDIIACLDTMLEYGADVNSRGSQGKTCLQKAAETGNHWLIKWLIFHNCDLNVQLKNCRIQLAQFQALRFCNEIPLLIAIKRADRVLVEVMIACGCEYRQYNYKWVLDYCRQFRLLYNSLVNSFSGVESLQNCCRKVIRRCLTTNIVAESRQLRLPVALQRYVLCQGELKDLDHWGT